MKRTIVKLLVILSTLFISVGSTVAYLTDVDQEANIMTLDRVEIDLIEQERNSSGTLVEFKDNHPLYPGYYPNGIMSYADGYYAEDYVRNAVDKIVTIKNTGKAPAYVRLWFAFEVTGENDFFNKKIHLNFNNADWTWAYLHDADGSYTLLKQNDTYYVVVIATYNQVLASGTTTPVSLRQVLLDSSATNDDLLKLGDKYSILVVAQGMQTAGFDSPREALDEGFGKPSLITNPFEGMEEETLNMGYIMVTGNRVNVRQTPSGTTVGQVPFNTVWPIIGSTAVSNGFTWYNIQANDMTTGEIIEGYIRGDYVYKLTSSEAALYEADPTYRPNIVDGHKCDYQLTGECEYVDEQYHQCIYKCRGCGNTKLEQQEHSVFVVTENVHRCICGMETQHDYEDIEESYIEKDKNTHTKNYARCSICVYNKTTTEPHAFDASGRCACGLREEDQLHVCDYVASDTYTYMSDLEHLRWYICENCPFNSTEVKIEKHSFDDSGKCVCGLRNPASDFKWEKRYDGTGITITRYIGNSETVVVPSTIEGMPVVGLDYYVFGEVFENNLTLTSVTIPSSVKYLDGPTFSYCPALTAIHVAADHPSYRSLGGILYSKDMTKLIRCPEGYTGTLVIPEGVTLISDGALEGCNKITSIQIPSSVMELNAIEYCDSLVSIKVAYNSPYFVVVDGVLFSKDMSTLLWCPRAITGSYTVPEGVLKIGGYAFTECEGLTHVSLPGGLRKIEGRAFAGCTGLERIIIPEGVYYIGGSFSGSGLKSIFIPSSVTSIGEWAFAYCWNLTSIDVAADNPNYTSRDGVLYTKDMKTLLKCPGGKAGAYTIPEGVKEIGEYSFDGCKKLTGVLLPDSITTISDWAFTGCTSLTSVYIPSSVTLIRANVFSVCTKLKSITVNGDNPNYASEDGVLFSKDKKTIIACPGAMQGRYTIPDGVTTIGYYAFSGCESLTGIDIPESVNVIDTCAFSLCRKLETIVIPSGVEALWYIFEDCTSLVSVTIPDSVKEIGDGTLDSFMCPNVTVLCSENSYAHKYCVENDIPFKLI